MTQEGQQANNFHTIQAYTYQSVEDDKKNTNHNLIYTNHNLILDHLPQYRQYFADVEEITDQKILSCNKSIENKMKHKIITMTNENDLSMLIDFNKAKVFVVGTQYNGLIVKYQVLLGNFKISVDMINRNIDAPSQMEPIGAGSYGEVVIIRIINGKNIACKRSVFRKKTVIWSQNQQGEQLRQAWQIKANIDQIHQTILQYSIYRICSFYKIGPSTVDCLDFDLVCFNNAIQFYMEQCSQIIKSNKYEHQLKICVRILHKMNIVHKDIKPANILQSFTQQSYVLTDFGISHPVQQKPGGLTQTYQQGTPGYMCPQIVNIENKTGLVDLYWNDLFAFKTSIKKLDEQYEQYEQYEKYEQYKQYKQYKQDKQDKQDKQKQSKEYKQNQQYHIYNQQKKYREYIKIKLIFMILNAEKHETTDFIYSYKLQKIFFEEIKFLQKHSIKYNKIREALTKNQTSQFKELPISNSSLIVQQIQFMVRAYGMTYQLINQLSSFQENWRIRNIVNSQNNISMRISTIQQLKVTAKQLRFIKSQEKRLDFMLNLLYENNRQYATDIINTSFTIFNFYIQFPIYYEYAENTYKKLAQLSMNQFSTEQKIQYQISSIILHLINKKEKNKQSKKRIVQLMETNPRETLLGYKAYFKTICLIQIYTEVIQEYNLFISKYKEIQFKKSDENQVKQLIQIKIRMASLYLQRYYPKELHIILEQIEELLQYYSLRSSYQIDMKLLKGSSQLRAFRFTKAVQILQQLIKFIRQNQGQNSYKIFLCKIELGRAYQQLNQLEKSEIYLFQSYQHISQIYGQNNKDFLTCLGNLIKLYIKKYQVNKVITLYDKWNNLVYKIFLEQNINRFNIIDIIKWVIRFYGENNLFNKIQIIFCEVKKKIQGKNSTVDYYYLQIIARYYSFKGDLKKQFQIRKYLDQQARLIFTQVNQIQLIIDKQYADCCLKSGKQYFLQAYQKYQYIISHTSKHNLLHIQSIYGIGMIQYQNQSYIKAYDYFNYALKLFIEAQNELIDIQIKFKFRIARCLISMNQYNNALKILLEISKKSQILSHQDYLRQYLLGKCYTNLNKISKSIITLNLLRKRIRSEYSNIKQLCIETISRKQSHQLVTHRVSQTRSIYPHLIQELYFLYYLKKMCLHAIYYIQYLGTIKISKPINLQNESIYTIFYKKYRIKKQRALKFELLYIESDPKQILAQNTANSLNFILNVVLQLYYQFYQPFYYKKYADNVKILGFIYLFIISGKKD